MQIIILGVGNVGQKLLTYSLQEGVEIVGVCDNNVDIQGKRLNGYEIVSPEIIKSIKYDYIIIASTKFNFVSEMEDQLSEMGVPKEKIVYCDGFAAIDLFHCELDKFFVIDRTIVPFKKGPVKITQKYEGETAKAYNRRVREGFFEKYCNGEGLDIGYGNDILTPECSGWDLKNGDAQYLSSIEDESFDYVYSSHCLEHMRDVRVALENWFRVVKKGGYLIVAIPHRDLYEKKKELPSRWNSDHKHMFLIGKEELPDTLDIIQEIKCSLENYDIKYVKACDEGHTIIDPLQHSDGEYQIEVVIKKKNDNIYE